MARLTRTVFGDLVLGTLTFGILVGVAFPVLVVYIGVPKSEVYTLSFFLSSICAGIIISGVSFFLTKAVVGRRLRLMAQHMRLVESKLAEFAGHHDAAQASDRHCGSPAIPFAAEPAAHRLELRACLRTKGISRR